jgi:hypothetical protein
MFTKPLDVESLLGELNRDGDGAAAGGGGAPEGG